MYIKKNIFILVVILFLVLFGFIIIKITKADTSDKMPQSRIYPLRYNSICDWPELATIKTDSLFFEFPYQKYNDSCNFWNVQSVKNDLNCLDSKFSFDSSMNRQVLSEALTSKLEKRVVAYFSGYQPDSLIVIIQWAEKYRNYAELEPQNELFYKSIYDYWMGKVASTVTAYASEIPSRKYNFKFKYLLNRCVEQRYSPGTKVTSGEKAFNNLIYNNWGHLINASWNQTSVLQKIVFFTFFVFTLIGYLLLGKLFFRKLFKSNKK